MDKNTDIKLQIADEYEQIRKNNALKQERLKLKIFQEIPQLQEIESELSEILKELLSAALSHSNASEDELEQLKDRVNELLHAKAQLLKAHHYPPNALLEYYECEACKDTGVINGELCKCYQKKLIDKLFENSQMHEMLKRDNFDNFDYGLFSNQVQGSGGQWGEVFSTNSSGELSEKISPRQNIEEIRCLAEEFIDNFEDPQYKNLFFFGKSGLGKTFMSSCIAREVLYKQFDVVYKTFYELMDIARAYKFENYKYDNRENISEMRDLILKTDLLIIDDLEPTSNNLFNSTELFHIINTRLLNNKKMIISSNIAPKDLSAAFGERIASRIHGNFIELEFIGDDLRLS